MIYSYLNVLQFIGGWSFVKIRNGIDDFGLVQKVCDEVEAGKNAIITIGCGKISKGMLSYLLEKWSDFRKDCYKNCAVRCRVSKYPFALMVALKDYQENSDSLVLKSKVQDSLLFLQYYLGLYKAHKKLENDKIQNSLVAILGHIESIISFELSTEALRQAKKNFGQMKDQVSCIKNEISKVRMFPEKKLSFAEIKIDEKQLAILGELGRFLDQILSPLIDILLQISDEITPNDHLIININN